MVQQSYREVFVTNSPTLLADGATVETIAVGQIGILDAKTKLSETAPTYATQKAIQLVWGTPNVPVLTNQGVPNENIYSKLIKGKKIKDWKGFKAKTTSTQQRVAIGNIGSGAETLVALKGEVKHVFVKLTGGQIAKKFAVDGVTRMYTVVDGLVGQTGNADSQVLANSLRDQINADKNINSFVTAVTKTAGAGLFGVEIQANQVDRVTDEATMQYFPIFEQDSVHIQISEFDPNYNNDIEAAVPVWKVTQTQAFSPAVGRGSAVQKAEKEALGYHLKNRSFDPVVRAIEGYQLQADPTKFYDEFVLEFEFDYKTGGWSDKSVDNYKVHVFFEASEGDAFETAINNYVASIGLALEPVNLY